MVAYCGGKLLMSYPAPYLTQAVFTVDPDLISASDASGYDAFFSHVIPDLLHRAGYPAADQAAAAPVLESAYQSARA